MLIAQITDLHVVGNGQLCQGRVATNTQLQEAVALINNLDLLAQTVVVLATGDAAPTMALSKNMTCCVEYLTAFSPPLYLIPGNHDHRDVFLEAFAAHAYLPRPGVPSPTMSSRSILSDWWGSIPRIPGQSYGVLCDERLAWLDATPRPRAAPRRTPPDAKSQCVIFPLPHRKFRWGCECDQSSTEGARLRRWWRTVPRSDGWPVSLSSPPNPGGVGWYYCLHGAEHLPRAGGLNFAPRRAASTSGML